MSDATTLNGEVPGSNPHVITLPELLARLQATATNAGLLEGDVQCDCCDELADWFWPDERPRPNKKRCQVLLCKDHAGRTAEFNEQNPFWGGVPWKRIVR